VFILLGGLLVDPVGSVKANTLTVATFEVVYVLAALLYFASRARYTINKNSPVNIIITVCFLYGLFLGNASLIDKMSYFFIILFAYIYSIDSPFDGYKKLILFLISYISISIFIYIVRAQMYGLDFNVLRGGVNIWGGSSLVSVIYLMITIQSILVKNRQTILLLSIVALIISFIFMTRLCIITSLFLVLIQLKNLSKNTSAILVTMLLLIFIFQTYSEEVFDFYQRLAMRFGSLVDADFNYSIIELLSPARAELWSGSFQLIENNWLGYGLGGVSNFSEYKDAHNLFINNIVDLGVLFGLAVNICLLMPIFMIARLNIDRMHRVIGVVAYLSYIVNAIITGLTVVQIGSYVSAIPLIYIFFIFNLLHVKLCKHA
jgi:hypothetical protein